MSTADETVQHKEEALRTRSVYVPADFDAEVQAIARFERRSYSAQMVVLAQEGLRQRKAAKSA